MARPCRRHPLGSRLASAVAALAVIAGMAANPAAARSRDRDGDGMSDRWERRVGLPSAKRSAAGDPDRDHLANLAEYRLHIHPGRRDTDGDRLTDGAEVRHGTNPRVPDHRPAGDGVVYVDPGSVGGACSDARTPAEAAQPKTPWCTIERAVAGAPTGSVALLRRGEYRWFVARGARLGTVTLRPYPGEPVTLRGGDVYASHLRFERFFLTGGVHIRPGVSNVAFVGNLWVTDGRSGRTNLAMDWGADAILIEGNLIAQAPGVGVANAIDFNSTNTRPEITNVTIRGNRIGPIAGGGDAIQAKHTRSLLVEDNEIFGVTLPQGSAAHPDVFQSIYGATDLTLRGNFIHDIAAQGIFVQNFRGPNSNLVVENNVIARVAYPWVALGVSANGARLWHNTVTGLIRFSGTGIDLMANIATGGLLPSANPQVARESHNLARRFWMARDQSSIVGAPSFRDAARNDFTLSEGSLGKRWGPDGSDVGAFRTAYPAP